MRRFLFLFLLVFLAAGPVVADDSAWIKKAEDYLNTLTRLQARLHQASSDGYVATGTFYLSRPGKMRLTYDSESPVYLVADGKNIVFYDGSVEQVTYLPLDEGLQSVLLQNQIFLNAGIFVVKSVRDSDQHVRISLESRGNPEWGTLTLVFTKEPLALRGWVMADAEGIETRVTLSDLDAVPTFSPDLFVFKDPRRGGKAGFNR